MQEAMTGVIYVEFAGGSNAFVLDHHFEGEQSHPFRQTARRAFEVDPYLETVAA